MDTGPCHAPEASQLLTSVPSHCKVVSPPKATASLVAVKVNKALCTGKAGLTFAVAMPPGPEQAMVNILEDETFWMVSSPEVAFTPLQDPEAEQTFAMLEVQDKVVEPVVFSDVPFELFTGTRSVAEMLTPGPGILGALQ